MCGIAGIYQPGSIIDRHVLESMNNVLAHRGPDDADCYLAPGIGLGHRRLSIIDLQLGHQPMMNADKSLIVVFNGEIYNYRLLRQKLIEQGCVFQTQSDTEVLIHGYQVWGEALPTYLRGMFAFALWDTKQQKLFIARDRLGVKPLYYTQLHGAWLFGSELKALTAHPHFNQALDPMAVADYFSYGYIPDPKSIYQGVYKLPPGHWLSLQGNKITCQAYWDVPALNPQSWDEQQWAQVLTDKIYESVECRLMAEVPLGAFLSGGVDSSIVVCEMAKALSKPVKTCSIGFEQASFDESFYAQQVARHLHTSHQMKIVRGQQVPSLEGILAIYDEPFADASAIPTLEVCRSAKEHVTVALSGDGGDEVFAGYRRYRGHLMEQRLRGRIPLSFRRSLFSPLAKWYPQLSKGPRFIRAKATFESLCFDAIEGYFYNISLFKPHAYQSLFTEEFQRSLQGYHPMQVLRTHALKYQGDCPLNLVQYLDLKTYLAGDILTKVDRASMHHSLEVRVPLLDHELMALAQTIPSSLKLHGHEGKYLLKKAYENRLPKEVLYRKKQGFAVPLGDWLRGPLRPYATGLISSTALVESNILNRAFLTKLVTEHLAHKADHSAMIWSLCLFDQFMRQHLNMTDKGEIDARIACA